MSHAITHTHARTHTHLDHRDEGGLQQLITRANYTLSLVQREHLEHLLLD